MPENSEERHCCLHRQSATRKKANRVIILTGKTKLKVGRSVVNDIQLPESPLISREHILLSREAEDKPWFIMDLKSSNGVFINDKRIESSKAIQLNEGDIVELGKDEVKNVVVYKYRYYTRARIKRGHNGEQGDIIETGESEAKRQKLDETSPTASHAKPKTTPVLLRQKMMEQERLLRQQFSEEQQKKEAEFAELQTRLKEAQEKEEQMKRVLEEREELRKKLEFKQESEKQLAEERESVQKQLEEMEKLRIDEQKKIEEQEKDMITKLKQKEEILEKVRKEAEVKCSSLTDLLEAKELQQAELQVEQEQAQQQLADIQEKSKKEKQEMEEKLRDELRKQLRDQELMLKTQLDQEMMAIQEEKKKVEKSLQKELEKVVQEKDKQLEEKLREQQTKLQQELESKEAEQRQLQEQLTVTREEIEKEKASGAQVKQQIFANMENAMEEELICVICDELFIQATSLGCSHSFCELCITQWQARKKECPNCRAPIKSSVRSLVLDSYIERMVAMLGNETKEKRTKLVQERKRELADFEKKMEKPAALPTVPHMLLTNLFNPARRAATPAVPGSAAAQPGPSGTVAAGGVSNATTQPTSNARLRNTQIAPRSARQPAATNARPASTANAETSRQTTAANTRPANSTANARSTATTAARQTARNNRQPTATSTATRPQPTTSNATRTHQTFTNTSRPQWNQNVYNRATTAIRGSAGVRNATTGVPHSASASTSTAGATRATTATAGVHNDAVPQRHAAIAGFVPPRFVAQPPQPAMGSAHNPVDLVGAIQNTMTQTMAALNRVDTDPSVAQRLQLHNARATVTSHNGAVDNNVQVTYGANGNVIIMGGMRYVRGANDVYMPVGPAPH